ncbi:MAG: transcriptional regulator [Acidobacteria bacterium]|nr:MAG: transcriptional regulator [Acidobacteriota bacterium]
MKEGDVAIAAVSQADRQVKKRPVIVLRKMPFPGDFLVCGISTQLRQQVAAFDELISPGDPDFGSSGLMVRSLIRLGFLRILPDREVVGAIGSISPERHRRLLSTLSDYLRPAL